MGFEGLPKALKLIKKCQQQGIRRQRWLVVAANYGASVADRFTGLADGALTDADEGAERDRH